MNYILFDDKVRRENLKPLTYFRPIAEIRIGILTIREKWEKHLDSKTSTLTEEYLSHKYPLERKDCNILINATILPTASLANRVKTLERGQTLISGDTIIALCADDNWFEDGETNSDMQEFEYEGSYVQLRNTYDIFEKNAAAIISDFDLITEGRKSQSLNSSNGIIGEGEIFIEEGAKINHAILNTNDGPIYIGKDAEVMEGSLIRGPFAMNEHSVVKMHAKIYPACTIGPHSKVAGELNNVVFFGYSNKGHDGFLGNSVIAEWCNFGAGTNNSNLKNDYGKVKLWNYSSSSFVDTGLQFCGLIMGDHSKCAIGTTFNTGTVVGVSSNIFGAGFHRNFIPSFNWGGPARNSKYQLKKAMKVAEIVYGRRDLKFDKIEKDIFEYVHSVVAGDNYL